VNCPSFGQSGGQLPACFPHVHRFIEEAFVGDLTSLLALAARQHGVFARRQALELGFSARQVDAHVQSGQWRVVRRGVYLVGGCPLDWPARLWCGVLSTGGVVSHRAAAALWGFDGFTSGLVELTVPNAMRVRQSGLVVHRSLDYDLRDECEQRGFPVTGVGRMLLDLGLKVSLERQADAMDEAIRRHLISWPGIYAVLARHACRGRDGVGPTRLILDERYGTKVPLSSWSRGLERLLVDAGLPRPRLEYVVTTEAGTFVAQVDAAYPQALLAMELQSKRFHLNESGFERDPIRRNRLRRLGWTVLEFTWRYFVEQPRALVAEVRSFLRDAGCL
jgi:Transcriptional regulator, AbiEi antitoxin